MSSNSATSYDGGDDERLFVRAAKKLLQPENEVIKLQYEDDDNVNLIHHQSAQVEKDQNVLFGLDSIHSGQVDHKSDGNKFEFRASDDDDDGDDDTLASSLSISLCDNDESEDAEEDYLIEIPLREPTVKRHKLKTEMSELVPEYPVSQSQQQGQGGLEDFLSDINDMSGEENLIEIDISMGSIRHSAFGV